ncbi:hypothetical protein INT46_005461 [Mucor plumbeus]|uniref:Uncharacterized protein n=1 Tax=Mucor plumbeus TaxID=97098 RepID=A0A8H7RC67_9FUNG|nr:hypothetical protein INT46_005461 [Mucor plumbeus]
MQNATNFGAKHVFASFMTRDYTFDLICQTWQAFLFPKKDIQKMNDQLPLQHQEDHADLATQIVQQQTIPEETAVSEQLKQQQKQVQTIKSTVNKQYQ